MVFKSKSNYSLFTRRSGTSFVALLVYVDDILLTGTYIDHILAVKTMLSSQFLLKDLGSAKYFLGLEIARSSTGLCLSQRKYCLLILDDSGLLNCKPSSALMDPNIKLSKDIGTPLIGEDITSYRRLVGRLLYLQISRRDICLAVHKLSQFLQTPTSSHLQAANHLLKYLKENPGQGILIKPITKFQLRAFVDAEWGACLDTRRSVTGFCVFLDDTLIAWKSKKQVTVSRSSAEAEYEGIAIVTSELLWITQVLHDSNHLSYTDCSIF